MELNPVLKSLSVKKKKKKIASFILFLFLSQLPIIIHYDFNLTQLPMVVSLHRLKLPQNYEQNKSFWTLEYKDV